jgi:D-sedoheptulose 7-phosphate isomerase
MVKKMEEKVMASIDEHREVVELLDPLIPLIATVAGQLIDCLKGGGKIIWMGNGGSAADAQHLAAELIGRFTRERSALPAIAVTTDSSIITAIANDYGFEYVFARQIEGLCTSKDAVVGISTSGNSPNVLAGIESAKKIGAYTVGFSGGASGGQLKQVVDACLHIPYPNTARVQECHIFIGHVLCDLIEAACMENPEHV